MAGFEQASQPTLTDNDRRKLLHFCVVGELMNTSSPGALDHAINVPASGGGPTGVEFAAELHDLLHSDAVKHYPSLSGMARISLYDVAPRVLGTY